MKATPDRSWTTLFFRNPHLLVISIVVVLVSGVSALRSLPRLEDPVIANRSPLIITAFPGASADRVEALVSEPIEQALKEIPSVKHIESTSRTGVSVVAIELQDAVNEKSNDALFSEIRDKLGDAATRFPPEVLPPVFDDKRNAVAFSLIIALHWEPGFESGPGLLTRQGEVLADQLRKVPGTELVRLYGAPEEEVRVTLDPDQLALLGLEAGAVAQALQSADAKSPAGLLQTGGAERLLEVEGELDSIARIREVPVRDSGEGPLVRLGDVADVSRTEADPPGAVALTNGRRAIFVAARVVPEERLDVWNQAALKQLADFREEMGGGIAASVVFEQNAYTSARLGELMGNLLLGAGVVTVVVLLTMGWRAAWIISCALPLTASMTLFVIAIQGGKLHQMSIFGMIVALGLLIDNAIVVTDEVRKQLRAGRSPLESVHAALAHLMVPLFASTVTTILAFLPILLLPGNAGDFVRSISGSVIVALICSYVVSILMIAPLAGWFGRAGKLEAKLPRWLNEGLGGRVAATRSRSGLHALLRRPIRGMAVALLLPVTGFLLVPTMGSQFFPRTDRNMFEVEVWLPNGTSLEGTGQVVEKIETILRQQPGVTDVHWLHGGSFPSVYYNLIMNKDRSPNYAHGIVEATDPGAVRRMIGETQNAIDREVPGAQVVVSKFAQGPPADADVEIRLTGPGIEPLQELGEQVRLALARHPGILQTRVTMPRGEPKLWIKPNEEAVVQAGLTLAGLGNQIRVQLDGIVAGSVIESIEILPVRLRLARDARDTPADLASLNLRTSQGWTPISALADIVLRPEQGGITRRDGSRINTIQGFAREGALPITIAEEVLAALETEGLQLPPGYQLTVGGESENQSEAVGNLTLYLPVLIVVTVATLILTFRSVRLALILLVVAPMSAGYGLLATWAAGFPLSFNTIIGSLGLMGLAFNSSIIVLAAIRADPAAARGEVDGMVTAIMGSARHLISTTLTTMGSFLPLLLFIGGEFWPPLAIVLAGGVGGSTLLAVLLTPGLYLWIYREKPGALEDGEIVDC